MPVPVPVITSSPQKMSSNDSGVGVQATDMSTSDCSDLSSETDHLNCKTGETVLSVGQFDF